MSCRHNRRCRYTNGYFCEDCDTFFSKDSQVYRETELLAEIGMVLHNINAQRSQEGLPTDPEVEELCKEFFRARWSEESEALISQAEVLMAKYGKNSNSASVTLEMSS